MPNSKSPKSIPNQPAVTHDREALMRTKQLAESIRFCMMTTDSPEGQLISRPMTTLQMDNEGCLWFFAADDAEQTVALDFDDNVNLAYAENSKYLSIAGSATLVKDKRKIDELWNPMVAAWFPEGKSDPRLCLIRVHPRVAEYWDGPSSRVVQLLGIAKALITGKTPDRGIDHARVSC